MTNSDKFKQVFGLYATEVWAMTETRFLAWLNADTQPKRKIGHWIDTGSGQECSECHEIQYGYDSGRFYCANCGAMMDGET